MILGGHHFAGANDAALCFKLYVAGRARGVVQMQFRLDRGLSGEVRLDRYRQTVEIPAWIWEIYDIYDIYGHLETMSEHFKKEVANWV